MKKSCQFKMDEYSNTLCIVIHNRPRLISIVLVGGERLGVPYILLALFVKIYIFFFNNILFVII